jgi:hypothetical protein
VKVHKCFGVHSSWIIKPNQSWFPKKALGIEFMVKEGPAGHYRKFSKQAISEVALFAMAYAWSQKGVSFLLSTCGSTEP